jgi:hypothetical protein
MRDGIFLSRYDLIYLDNIFYVKEIKQPQKKGLDMPAPKKHLRKQQLEKARTYVEVAFLLFCFFQVYFMHWVNSTGRGITLTAFKVLTANQDTLKYD